MQITHIQRNEPNSLHIDDTHDRACHHRLLGRLRRHARTRARPPCHSGARGTRLHDRPQQPRLSEPARRRFQAFRRTRSRRNGGGSPRGCTRRQSAARAPLPMAGRNPSQRGYARRIPNSEKLWQSPQHHPKRCNGACNRRLQGPRSCPRLRTHTLGSRQRMVGGRTGESTTQAILRRLSDGHGHPHMDEHHHSGRRA